MFLSWDKMPKKLARPCNYPGCPCLVAGNDSRCDKHKKQIDREYDKHRGTAASRGYDAKWKRARDIFLRVNTLCVECEKEDRLVPATVVDHIIPHKGDYELFWDKNNWQSLCKRHHDMKTVRESRRINLRPKDMKHSLSPLTIICGPPGSGKSHYVDNVARDDDLIIDLDVIKAQVTGTSIYDRSDTEALRLAIDKRNSILRELSKKKKYSKVYFIVMGAKQSEREWWKNTLGATDVIVLDTPLNVCIDRINADDRRPEHVKRQHIITAKTWWRNYS